MSETEYAGYREELMKFLSQESGLARYEKVDITFEENKARKRIYIDVDGYTYRAHIQYAKGGVEVIALNEFKMDAPLAFQSIPLDYKIDRMYYRKYRSIDEFGIEYELLPDAYTYCEGNGWTSKRDVYIVKGKRFVFT